MVLLLELCVVYLLIPTSNHNVKQWHSHVLKLYIFWFLHQTTTRLRPALILGRCISFDSYIKPQLILIYYFYFYVVYLLIPTSNHNFARLPKVLSTLYIFWFLHQTTTYWRVWYIIIALYIFWFLHQTTTLIPLLFVLARCISFDSYIKPQHSDAFYWLSFGCISFDSYIKPQLVDRDGNKYLVVYLLIPTSNHNLRLACTCPRVLYIFWFLHQTTTPIGFSAFAWCCISFDSYIKPQRWGWTNEAGKSCISFDSYIKPQPVSLMVSRLLSCISFDSYIKPQQKLHCWERYDRCISFDSYIKPQQELAAKDKDAGCISFDSYIKPQQRCWIYR